MLSDRSIDLGGVFSTEAMLDTVSVPVENSFDVIGGACAAVLLGKIDFPSETEVKNGAFTCFVSINFSDGKGSCTRLLFPAARDAKVEIETEFSPPDPLPPGSITFEDAMYDLEVKAGATGRLERRAERTFAFPPDLLGT
jgi:hypothetical protein